VFKRFLVGTVIAVFAAGVGFFVYAWHPAVQAIDPPSTSAFPDALVERGRVLSGGGNCASCHTVAGREDYSGGYAIQTDFGTIYSTNITPDPDTGIGRWSEIAFVRAMRRGIRRDGAHLYPAFPFDHFTKLGDSDLSAIYAYFMSRPPVKGTIPDNTLAFPLNVRLLQAGWKLLYLDAGAYEPNPDNDETWNRGAYLAEGLTHCGACHSPRNTLGAEKSGLERYAGAVIDGWYAPPLTVANAAALPWTEAELYEFLRKGVTDLHGVAGGPMSDVVHRGLTHLADDDIRALAVYFSELAEAPAMIRDEEIKLAMTERAPPSHSATDEVGAQLYASACAACHYNRPGAPLAARPEMALNSAVTGPDPTTFIRLVLQGVGKPDGHPEAFMHGFAPALKDQDIAVIASHLRRAYVSQENNGRNELAWRNLESQVRTVRQRSEGIE
jgi:mono/diheme cytochrome c family protein